MGLGNGAVRNRTRQKPKAHLVLIHRPENWINPLVLDIMTLHVQSEVHPDVQYQRKMYLYQQQEKL